MKKSPKKSLEFLIAIQLLELAKIKFIVFEREFEFDILLLD